MNKRYFLVGVIGLAIGAALMAVINVLYLSPRTDTGDDFAASSLSDVAVNRDEAYAVALDSNVEQASSQPSVLAPVYEETPNSGDGGTPEGIKVRGLWTVDILEPDGTLVSRREFENSLLVTGGRRIADIIGRRMLPRYWGIRLRHNLLSNSPCLSGSNATACVIYEPQGINASFTSNNLVVTPNSAGVLILSGTIAAQRDGQITSVTTLHNGRPCAVGVNFPDGCAGSAGTEVTRTSISPAINVITGQVISATVRISFE